MLNRARFSAGANDVRDQQPGDVLMSQLNYEANTTAGDSTLTVSSLLNGIINRSGPGGAYTDTLPTIDQLLAAAPNLTVGDSFTFLHRNTVAQACTLAIGTGWTLGSNTAIAASLVREYLVKIGSHKPTHIFVCTITNANKVLTNVPATSIRRLMPGMAVTGTGIGASAKIVAVNEDAGTVTVDVNSSASADNIAVTATPTATIEGVRSTTL